MSPGDDLENTTGAPANSDPGDRPQQYRMIETLARERPGTTTGPDESKPSAPPREIGYVGKPALQELIYSRGYLLIMRVKCHPEMAGNGIEFAWGIAKLQFRRRLNDRTTTNQSENVAKALSSEHVRDKNGNLRGAPLPLERVRKYSRRARVYRNLSRLYGDILLTAAEKMDITGFDLLERM